MSVWRPAWIAHFAPFSGWASHKFNTTLRRAADIPYATSRELLRRPFLAFAVGQRGLSSRVEVDTYNLGSPMQRLHADNCTQVVDGRFVAIKALAVSGPGRTSHERVLIGYLAQPTPIRTDDKNLRGLEREKQSA